MCLQVTIERHWSQTKAGTQEYSDREAERSCWESGEEGGFSWTKSRAPGIVARSYVSPASEYKMCNPFPK